jgi:hypothetical protein
MKHGLAIALFALLPFASGAALGAESGATDQPPAPSGPSLPAKEHFIYARKIGDKVDVVETSSRLVDSEGGSWYEFTSHSPEQDLVLKLDPATLIASYSEVTSRAKNATLRRVTTVLENRNPAQPDEIVVSGMDSLPYTLRAFPWGSRQRASISFLGTGLGGSFRFDLSVEGKETISVAGRDVECWKAQLSLGGLLGSFFGRSYLWYSTDPPHYLVKSETASAGPGSPTSILTLQSYSAEGTGE